MEGQWNVNANELAEIKAIADSNLDTPVLMININIIFNPIPAQTAFV